MVKRQLHPELASEIRGPLYFFDCDTEGDLPSPAWGKFAVVREADGRGRHYLYIGTATVWKRAELELIGD